MQIISPEYMLAQWKRQEGRQEYTYIAVILLELPERS